MNYVAPSSAAAMPLAHTGPALFGANDSSTLLVVGILIMAFFLLRFLLRPRRKSEPYHSPLRGTSGTISAPDVPTDPGRWEVQMHETARHLMGELNTKIAIVEQLIRDANAAAERLENALRRADEK